MKTSCLDNIAFIDKKEPIELFCSQKYKGYYLRGQIVELSDNINDYNLPESYGFGYYHLRIFVLINGKYASDIEEEDDDIYFSQFGLFAGKTKTDFLKIREKDTFNSAKRLAHQVNMTSEQLFTQLLSEKNPPLETPITEFGQLDTPYVLNSIKKKKDII